MHLSFHQEVHHSELSRISENPSDWMNPACFEPRPFCSANVLNELKANRVWPHHLEMAQLEKAIHNSFLGGVILDLIEPTDCHAI